MAYEADIRVIQTHQRLLREVRERVTRFVTVYYRDLGSWRDADIARFIETVVPVVEGGQKQVAQLTNSYLDSMARLAGLRPSPPAALAEYPRPIPIQEVYRRPAVTTYTALADGKSLEAAVQEGIYRLTDIVATDMQLAQTHAARARAAGDDRISYTKRVLTGSENCLLCTLAASQRYRKEDLLPIHPGCDCTVEHVFGSRAVSDAINAEIYDRAMAAQGTADILDTHGGGGEWKKSATTKRKYNDQREATNLIITHDHGEYGPTLSWRNQKFTSEADILRRLA